MHKLWRLHSHYESVPTQFKLKDQHHWGNQHKVLHAVYCNTISALTIKGRSLLISHINLHIHFRIHFSKIIDLPTNTNTFLLSVFYKSHILACSRYVVNVEISSSNNFIYKFLKKLYCSSFTAVSQNWKVAGEAYLHIPIQKQCLHKLQQYFIGFCKHRNTLTVRLKRVECCYPSG